LTCTSIMWICASISWLSIESLSSFGCFIWTSLSWLNEAESRNIYLYIVSHSHLGSLLIGTSIMWICASFSATNWLSTGSLSSFVLNGRACHKNTLKALTTFHWVAWMWETSVSKFWLEGLVEWKLEEPMCISEDNTMHPCSTWSGSILLMCPVCMCQNYSFVYFNFYIFR
jgi:hypothetical protein